MTTSTNITSTNWSGAVLTAASGQSFSSVSAEWVVPAVSQVPAGNVTTSDVSEWVGIDGYNSSDVCQAGIQETVQTAGGKTSVSVSAWDEWYPAGSNTIAASSFSVNAGDTVKITVQTLGVGSSTASFIFNDVTTGKTYDASLTAPKGTTLVGNSAEVVAETPEWTSGGQTSQPLLADFLNTPITFKDIAATYKSGSAASLSSAQSIGMETNAAPGSTGSYVQEAYGSVNASADSVSVTENDYWGASTSPATKPSAPSTSHWSPPPPDVSLSWSRHHWWG
jgi:Peptidase A4 family